ncbi:UNKNOWN [Stylonychia lemnae]|uniref:Uncharacterized protein n=1 Tax=Stylonychia lemnae TaxID=5949 RepID=A0A078AK83_STYLE|nr:UNKNOWN [Stylonychia lemnae]|eukprot:CDW81213.1 UNKNOWN [Stylonychia lemnae]
MSEIGSTIYDGVTPVARKTVYSQLRKQQNNQSNHQLYIDRDNHPIYSKQTSYARLQDMKLESAWSQVITTIPESTSIEHEGYHKELKKNNSFDNNNEYIKNYNGHQGLISYQKSKLLMSPGLDISQMDITRRNFSNIHSRPNESIDSSTGKTRSNDRRQKQSKNNEKAKEDRDKMIKLKIMSLFTRTQITQDSFDNSKSKEMEREITKASSFSKSVREGKIDPKRQRYLSEKSHILFTQQKLPPLELTKKFLIQEKKSKEKQLLRNIIQPNIEPSASSIMITMTQLSRYEDETERHQKKKAMSQNISPKLLKKNESVTKSHSNKKFQKININLSEISRFVDNENVKDLTMKDLVRDRQKNILKQKHGRIASFIQKLVKNDIIRKKLNRSKNKDYDSGSLEENDEIYRATQDEIKSIQDQIKFDVKKYVPPSQHMDDDKSFHSLTKHKMSYIRDSSPDINKVKRQGAGSGLHHMGPNGSNDYLDLDQSILQCQNSINQGLKLEKGLWKSGFLDKIKKIDVIDKFQI